MHSITVSPESAVSSDFHSLQEAIDSIPADNSSPVTIELAPGTYHEKIILEKPNVTLTGLGKDPADTVISFDDFAYFMMPEGKKRGTFRSYTLFVHAHDVTLRNLTVENASGDSKTHGQAIALYAECDRFMADNCRLLGHQDTLFTGPLPPKEYEPDGFLGPTQFAPRINGRQYYKNCYICGDIDFIFGSATAFFEDCIIESLRRSIADSSEILDHTSVPAAVGAHPAEPEGYATAASTPKEQEYGYVFWHCRFTSTDCPPASVYLGRPWRDFARTVLIECALGAHIHPAGFHDWNKEAAHETVFFAEYGSHPLNAHAAAQSNDRRADFVQTLSDTQTVHYTKDMVLSGADGWSP